MPACGREDNKILILTRRVGEAIKIGDNIEIKVMGIGRGIVKIGIEAPKDVPVHREEVYDRIQAEKKP